MANNEKLGAKKSENVQETESFGTRFINFFVKYQNVIFGVIIVHLQQIRRNCIQHIDNHRLVC